jgi:preprotein translocase subunit SecG
MVLFSKQREMKTNLNFIEKYSYSIIIGVLFFVISFLFFSCSARTSKTDKSKVDSTATAKTEIAVKEKETIKEAIKSDSTSSKKKETIVNIFEDALELEPIDPKQESSFTDNNGNVKTFKNVRIKRNQSQNNSTINESENIQLIKEKNTEIATLKDSIYNLNSEIAISKEVVKKLSIKEQFNWSTFVLSFWWLILIIIIICYSLYRYKKGVLNFPLL